LRGSISKTGALNNALRCKTQNRGNGSIATNVGGDHNEITAKGSQLTVTPSGTRTFDVQAKLARRQFALQYSPGVVKFRKMEIKPL
jgi:hypothetical protein